MTRRNTRPLQEREAEAIAHCKSKGPRVHVERWRWESVKPITGVRESEGVKADFVAYKRGVEEISEVMMIDFGDE